MGRGGLEQERKIHGCGLSDIVQAVAIVIPLDVFFGTEVPLQNEIGFFVVGRAYTTNEKFRVYSYTPGIGAFTYLAIGF